MSQSNHSKSKPHANPSDHAAPKSVENLRSSTFYLEGSLRDPGGPDRRSPRERRQGPGWATRRDLPAPAARRKYLANLQAGRPARGRWGDGGPAAAPF